MKDSRITVTASYLYQRERWQITIHKGDRSVTSRPLFRPILPDFRGKKFEKEVDNLAKELGEYGITKKQIEDAILKACRRDNIKPPKYLRK